MTAPDFKDISSYLQGLEDRISALESAPLSSAGITNPATGVAFQPDTVSTDSIPETAPASATAAPGATSTEPPVIPAPVALNDEEKAAIQSAEDTFEGSIETTMDTVAGHPAPAIPFIDPASDQYVPENDPRNAASVVEPVIPDSVTTEPVSESETPAMTDGEAVSPGVETGIIP